MILTIPMKQNLLKNALIIFTCFVMASCRKGDMKPGAPLDAGLYILNTGFYDGTSASALTFYDLGKKKTTADEYNAVNGKTLGDGGNDMEVYGSKMYIVATNSSVVDIVNPRTGKLIKETSLLNPTNGAPWYNFKKSPRNIAFYKSNAYISCYDGTIAIMDTINFSVNAVITLPRVFYLEGLVVQNNKLYVADAGLETCVTNMVSVIDLATNKEIRRINVIPSPVSLAADSYGNVYVLSNFTDDWQQFNISLGGLTIIDSETDTVRSQTKTEVYGTARSIPISVNGDLVYYAKGSKIEIYNAKTQTLVSTGFVTDGTTIKTPYAIGTNPVTGEVYISDTKDYMSNGSVNVFDKTGKLEYSFSSSLNPVKIKMMN
jgi:YVTN family beta-propeller protein